MLEIVTGDCTMTVYACSHVLAYRNLLFLCWVVVDNRMYVIIINEIPHYVLKAHVYLKKSY